MYMYIYIYINMFYIFLYISSTVPLNIWESIDYFGGWGGLSGDGSITGPQNVEGIIVRSLMNVEGIIVRALIT